MFKILLSKDAADFLGHLDFQAKERIKKKLEILETDPYPQGVQKIIGTKNIFRLRIGDYRALYFVDYLTNTIIVDKIDKRSRVYK
ncbi:MAG TPA: type II toxin-antitoxin system RelE/ParE family toxin [archaeon]|nr:type II toxin-antitoxin system RelE/ParE family toxin [archaeon]